MSPEQNLLTVGGALVDEELEKIFSSEVLAALDERIRRIAREEAGRAEDEWLDIPAVMQLTRMTQWAVR